MQQMQLLIVIATAALCMSTTTAFSYSYEIGDPPDQDLGKAESDDFTLPKEAFLKALDEADSREPEAWPQTWPLFAGGRFKRSLDKHDIRRIKSARATDQTPRAIRVRRAIPSDKNRKATEQLVGAVKDMMDVGSVPVAKRPMLRNALREVEKGLNSKPSKPTGSGSSTLPKISDPLKNSKPTKLETQIPRPPMLPAQPPSVNEIAQKLKVKSMENELQRVQKAYVKEKEKSLARSKAKVEKSLPSKRL